MTEPPSPIPAATLVLMRDRTTAPPELLMVERAPAMTFAPGALVFPGGRVDPGDLALAVAMGSDDERDGAARIAAIRETIEEVGLAIGLSPMPEIDTVDAMRADLRGGAPFADVLARAGCTIDPAMLVPFARWRPAHRIARIFDTRFYLARAPEGPGIERVDGTENVRLVWASGRDILADADKGLGAIIYPTRRNLERLARFASYDDAVRDARSHPVRTITPFEAVIDGASHLCIPEGLGYPITSEPFEGAMRG